MVEILGLEPLHRELTALFEIARLESDELARKASRLGALLEQYAVE